MACYLRVNHRSAGGGWGGGWGGGGGGGGGVAHGNDSWALVSFGCGSSRERASEVPGARDLRVADLIHRVIQRFGVVAV